MSPFSLMRRMMDDFDRMFLEPGRGDDRQRAWSPAVEVSEKDGKFTVCAELAGLKPEDVKLEVADDAIVIQGERKSEEDRTEGGVHMTERRYGHFYRAIPLPEGAQAEQARASFANGVLEVTVPTSERRSNRRQIPIQGSSSAEAGKEQSTGKNKAA